MKTGQTIITQEMFVKTVTASCVAGEARTVRQMELVTIEKGRSTGWHESAITMRMECPEGVTSGDVLTVTVAFERETIEEELLRQIALEAELAAKANA